jgi:hypothetical protein
MMTKTILSDGRHTRPRFAAPTPTPPKFLIATDDPARIGILSDQRESKGFGWDPAKTLRMAEPPKFLIGTFQQSKNHSTPSKQTTNPNPNSNKTRVSRPPLRIADSPWRFAASHHLRSYTRASLWCRACSKGTAGRRTLPYHLRCFTRATSRARVRALRKSQKCRQDAGATRIQL